MTCRGSCRGSGQRRRHASGGVAGARRGRPVPRGRLPRVPALAPVAAGWIVVAVVVVGAAGGGSAIAADAGEKAARVGRELEDEIRVRLDPEQVRRFNRLQEVRQLQRERVKQGERPAPGQLERWRERQRPSIVAPEPGEAKSP